MLKTVNILSAGRSGSTLTSLILGSHPNAISIGELFFLPKDLALNSICACGSSVSDCGFWQKVLRHVSDVLGLDIQRNPYCLELGFIGALRNVDPTHQTRLYWALWKSRHALIRLQMHTGVYIPQFIKERFTLGITNTLAVYDAIRRISQCNVVVDSSKGYLRGIALYKRDPDATRLLLLFRDGRGRLLSGLRSGQTRRSIVHSWRKYYEHALPLLTRHVNSNHWLTVRYEDLAADATSETQRICRFLNLPFNSAMVDFRRKQSHVVSGNDMRLQSVRGIVLDTAWKQELASDDLRYFEKHGGAMNRRLGYT